MKFTQELVDRIVKRCVITEGPLSTPCWLWQGATRGGKGYGAIGVGRTAVLDTHRVMYFAYNNLPTSKIFVLHECDQATCCNPAHLFAGTQKDNINDMISKGRKYYKPRREVRINWKSNATPIEIKRGRAV